MRLVLVSLLTLLLSTPASAQWRRWNIANGTTTSGTDTLILVDSSATFQTDTVPTTATVYNLTDGSSCTITTVDSETQITLNTCTGGTDDNFDSGDAYHITETTGSWYPDASTIPRIRLIGGADLNANRLHAALHQTGGAAALTAANIGAESATSNDFDPDRLACDVADDNDLIADACIPSAIARDSELPTAASLSVDDLITLSGVAGGSTDLGTFTGTTITDAQTTKAALQLLETSLEGITTHFLGTVAGDNDCTGQEGQSWWDSTDTQFEWCDANTGTPAVLGSAALGTDSVGTDELDDGVDVPAVGDFVRVDGTSTALFGYSTPSETQAVLSVDDLIMLSGVAEGSLHHGTFSGATISDDQTTHDALQLLETALEAITPGSGDITSVFGDDTGAVDALYQTATAFGANNETGTPNVVTNGKLVYKTADTTQITDFDDGTDHTGVQDGRQLLIFFQHAAGFDCSGSQITCNNDVDWVAVVGDFAFCIFDDTNGGDGQWLCQVSRPTALPSGTQFGSGDFADAANGVNLTEADCVNWEAETPGTDVTFCKGNDDIFVSSVGLEATRIPQGTAPTVDAAGEVANDTTADQLVYGASARVALSLDTKCMTIETPADPDNFLFFRAERGITVTGIDCLVGAATSAVVTVQECDANGGTCSAVEAAMTCAATNTTEAAGIDNAAIDTGDWLRVDVGTVTGTVGQVSVCMTYQETRQ